MASIERYYDYDKVNHSYYATHIAIDNHFSNLLFSGDSTRIVTATNGYALRARSDQFKDKANLRFPFMNYKRNAWDFFEGYNKHAFNAFYQGVYIPELGSKVKYDPIYFGFEGTIWFAREDDMVYAMSQMRFDLDGQTQLIYYVDINGVTIPVYIEFEYNELSLDPSYNESDWLRQNKIHTIGFNFRANTFDLQVVSPNDGDFSITEKVLFDFAVNNCQDVATYEEALEFAVKKIDGVDTVVLES
jgi:hypothetical protein